MFVKNSQTIINRNTMNTDEIILEWIDTNVKHDNLILNMTNFNFYYFHRPLSTDFVRIMLSDGRINLQLRN